LVIPWIFYQEILGAKRKLSDIEFLAVKEFDGKLRTNEGFLSATGDLATLTANTGKDMYLARAQVTIYLNELAGASVATSQQVVLKMNGIIIETSRASLSQVGTIARGTGVTALVYEFKNIGQKVLAGQIIKLEVITLAIVADVEGFIECWEEPTGDTPQVASI